MQFAVKRLAPGRCDGEQGKVDHLTTALTKLHPDMRNLLARYARGAVYLAALATPRAPTAAATATAATAPATAAATAAVPRYAAAMPCIQQRDPPSLSDDPRGLRPCGDGTIAGEPQPVVGLQPVAACGPRQPTLPAFMDSPMESWGG